MDDDRPEKIDDKVSDSEARHNAASQKVVPIRPRARKPLGDSRLEEIRRLLGESVPDPDPLDDGQSDARVIEDEEAFRRRFGLGFDWPRRHREALILLKREKDLTDSEIRLFRHTGNLKRTPFGVELAANRWVALWGGLQLVLFGTLFGALCIAAMPNLMVNPVKALRAVIGLGGLLALCYAIFWLYIKPWIVQRRVETVRL